MEHRRAVLLALIAGCYSARPPEGAPCQVTQDCPAPQRCVLGSCTAHDTPLVDAAAPAADAPEVDAPAVAADAALDAMVLPCSITGLSCGGSATTFTCGGHCWVHCTGSATWAAASQACIGWMGALGAIDDALEQSCVEMKVSTATWIGLRQGDTATDPAQGWNWNTSAVPVGYMHWQSGTPDDRDGNENHDEQCGKIQSDGTWDDVTCSATTGFLCER